MVYIKRGDTLTIQVVRKDSEGTPQTGQTEFLSSQIRDSNDILIAEFTIEESEVLGTYLFTVDSAETANFPVETLYFDIELNDGATIESTDTVLLIVKKDVTI